MNKNGRKQCGLCASCLLRRLSLHAAGVREKDSTYIISDLGISNVAEALSVLSRKEDRNIMIEYGSVGTRHLQQLADMADLPDDKLRADVRELATATNATFEETMNNLRAMLMEHAKEWQAFLSAQGKQSFLKSWIEGGRHV